MKPSDYNLCSEEDQQKYTQAGYWQSKSLGQLLHDWAASYGDKTALVDRDIRLSYKELDAKTDRLAAGFYHLGIRAGDKVLVQMPNCHEFVAVCFALFRVGALPIMVMPAQRESDVSALCEIAEPTAYIVADSFLGFDYIKLAETVYKQQASLKHVIINGNSGRFASLDDIEKTPTNSAISLSEPEANTPALLLLSGGTTGTPKLIPRTHADYA